MRYEVRLPSLGDEDDAVTGGTVTAWLANVGDTLPEDGDLLELTTDKAAFVVPAPRAGRLVEQCAAADDEVHVGDLIAVLETED